MEILRGDASGKESQGERLRRRRGKKREKVANDYDRLKRKKDIDKKTQLQKVRQIYR